MNEAIGYALNKDGEDYYLDATVSLTGEKFQVPITAADVKTVERTVYDYPEYITEYKDVEVDDGEGGTMTAQMVTGKITPSGIPVERKVYHEVVKDEQVCCTKIEVHIAAEKLAAKPAEVSK